MLQQLRAILQKTNPFQWNEPDFSPQEQLLDEIRREQKVWFAQIQSDAEAIFTMSACGFYKEAYALLVNLRTAIIDFILYVSQQDKKESTPLTDEHLLVIDAEQLTSTADFSRRLNMSLSQKGTPHSTEIDTILASLRLCLIEVAIFTKTLEKTSLRTSLDKYKAQQLRRRNYFLSLFFLLSFTCLFSAYLSYKSVMLIVYEARSYFTDRKRSIIHTNIIENRLPPHIRTTNLGPLETDVSGIHFSWALGPEMKINFVTPLGREMKLSFRVTNPIPGQSIKITVNNGEHIKVLENLKAQPWITGSTSESFVFHSRPGDNSIYFIFSDWNNSKTTFAPQDGRPLAIAFMDLQLDTIESN